MRKEKKQNLNWARNMDIDAWRERQITKRLKEHLAESNRRFEQEHADDTDEELRELVRRKAAAKGRMLHPLELPGGVYLKSRLGDWNRLAVLIGYPPLSDRQGERAYRSLYDREAELFAQERRIRKKEKRMRAQQKQNHNRAFSEAQ